MSWCESQEQVEYVLAHGSNPRLQKLSWGVEQRAKAAYEQQRSEIARTLEGLVATPAELKTELDALVPPQVWYLVVGLPDARLLELSAAGGGQTHLRWQRGAAALCRHLLGYGCRECRQTPRGLLLPQRGDGKSYQRASTGPVQ